MKGAVISAHRGLISILEARSGLDIGWAVQEASRAGRGRLPDELENSAEWMTSMCAVTLHCMRFLEGRQKGTVWILELQKAEIRWIVQYRTYWVN